jgi:hypothetical protein
MWGWIRITKNCSAMHRGIALHLFNEEIPPSSLPSLYRFTTWLLVLLVASSSSLSLHDVDCSVLFFLVFTKCCLSWLSIIFTSSILILSIYFLVCNSFPSCCHSPNLEENLWLLDHQLLPNPLWIFHISSCAYGWGCDVADCWIKFSPSFVPTFSLLVYWCVVYFQKPKTDFTLSPSLLTWLSCHSWDARDLVPEDCLAGH